MVATKPVPPAPPEPTGLMSQDRLTMLIALRAEVARRIGEADGTRDLAPLVKQLREIATEIDGLAESAQRRSEVSVFDELAERRARRAQQASTAAKSGRNPGRGPAGTDVRPVAAWSPEPRGK